MVRRSTLGRPGPVNAETTAMIRLMVDAPDPVTVKSAVQRACELIEGGRAFVDPSFLVLSLRKHLRSPDSKVRRWSYKLAGRLREPSLLPFLLEAIWCEAGVDEENRSWAFAAYIGYAPAPERRALIAKLDQEYHGTSLDLSARFFSLGEPEPVRTELGLGHFDEDPLRKWLTFLCAAMQQPSREPSTRSSPTSTSSEVLCSMIIRRTSSIRSGQSTGIRKATTGACGRSRKTCLITRTSGGGCFRFLQRPRAPLRGISILSRNQWTRATNHPQPCGKGSPWVWQNLACLRDGWRRSIGFSPRLHLPVKLALVDHLALRARQGDNVALGVLKATYMDLEPLDLLAMKIKAASDPEVI